MIIFLIEKGFFFFFHYFLLFFKKLHDAYVINEQDESFAFQLLVKAQQSLHRLPRLFHARLSVRPGFTATSIASSYSDACELHGIYGRRERL